MGNRSWWEAYQAWERDCLREWNERYQDNRTATEVDDETDPSSIVEFSETGHAYPYGRTTGYVQNAVTPWRESAHYLEV